MHSEFYFLQYPLHVSNKQAIHHQEPMLYTYMHITLPPDDE